MSFRVGFSILATFFVTWSAFASAGELKYAAGGVPTAKEREASGLWTRQPFFSKASLEPVHKEGEKDSGLVALLANNAAFQGWLKKHDRTIDSFSWLMLRELDVQQGLVTQRGINTEIVIPLAFGIRYVALTGESGTLNVAGELHVVLTLAGQVRAIDLLTYDDSQPFERISRTVGVLKKFDGEFIAGVSEALLTDFFSDPRNLGNTLAASKVMTNGEEFLQLK